MRVARVAPEIRLHEDRNPTTVYLEPLHGRWRRRFAFGEGRNNRWRGVGGPQTLWGWRFVFGEDRNRAARSSQDCHQSWRRRFVFGEDQNPDATLANYRRMCGVGGSLSVRIAISPRASTLWRSRRSSEGPPSARITTAWREAGTSTPASGAGGLLSVRIAQDRSPADAAERGVAPEVRLRRESQWWRHLLRGQAHRVTPEVRFRRGSQPAADERRRG
jgi:hypothetical protein